MKIGILTLPLEMNYGGILQSYALQQVLIRKGHDVMTIDRHNRRKYPSFPYHVIAYLKRLKEYYIEHKNVSINWNPFMDDNTYRLLSANTRDFVSRNMRMTREVWSDQLAEIESEYRFNAYVVGSDQVWLSGYYPSSFLDFVKRDDVIKFFYAASCNEKKSFVTNPQSKKSCRFLASQFCGISVREDTLLPLCSEKLGRDGVHVLDPTLLLDKEDYIAVIKSELPNSPCVFSYILDKNVSKQHLVQMVSEIVDDPIVTANAPRGWVKGKNIDVEDCVQPSIDDWLHNLLRAEYVVTDSFHGTCFAIIFQKQFIVVGNAKRGMNRFHSLLRMFNLENRLVIDPMQIDIKKLVESRIDYTEVNQRLAIYKEKSIAYIDKCLSSINEV